MQLKRIIVLLSLFGFTTSSIFAAPDGSHHESDQQNTKVSKSNINTHHAITHAKKTPVMHYKDEIIDMVPLLPPFACHLSQTRYIFDSMSQNISRAMPDCNPAWFRRLHVSGGINVDMGKWRNHYGDYEGENYRRVSVNDAYISITADVNEWTHAFLSMSYDDATSSGFVDSDHYAYAHVYEAHKFDVRQAYITIANFDCSPFFLQLGKQFQDYGRYIRHPVTRSMTQVMSETLRSAVKVGFIVPSGFHGSVYAFDDTIRKINRQTFPTNYGAALGFDRADPDLGWDVGVGYMYNMISAKDVAHAVTNFTGIRAYHKRVGGAAIYADMNSGPFYFGARFTLALRRFSRNDLPKNGIADLIADDIVDFDAEGAKPWAAGITAGYGFDAFCKSQSIYVGYQASRQAAGIGLPRNRWLAGYNIEAWPNTNFGIEWDRDRAYSHQDGGTQKKHSNLFTIRTAVKFG